MKMSSPSITSLLVHSVSPYLGVTRGMNTSQLLTAKFSESCQSTPTLISCTSWGMFHRLSQHDHNKYSQLWKRRLEKGKKRCQTTLMKVGYLTLTQLQSTANFISWLRKVKRCHVIIFGSVLMTTILIVQDHWSPSLCTVLMNSATAVLCLHLNMSTVLTLPLASTESKVKRRGSTTPITDVPNRRCIPTLPVSLSSAVRSSQPLLAHSWSAVASCSSACGRCAHCCCAWWWCW